MVSDLGRLHEFDCFLYWSSLIADTELTALHQNRIIGESGQYPIYVELRSRESPPNDARQSCLSFVYANIYALRRMANGERQLTVESVNLDSIKGLTATINFIGIENSSHIVMSWSEQTVTRTRGGLCKYSFKVPDYDSVESILDFAYLQHTIKSLAQLTGMTLNPIFQAGANFHVFFLQIIAIRWLDAAIESFPCGIIAMATYWWISKLIHHPLASI